MILTLDALLSPAQLAIIQTHLRDASWDAGSHTAGSLARTVKHNSQLPADSAALQHIRQQVADALQRHPVFLGAVLPRRVFPPRVNRHGVGDHYGPHYDNAVLQGPQGVRVRSDVSCTLFLNEPDTYDGGELQIADTFGEHRIKLPAGSAVLYPSSSLHQVLPVTQGERLACFFWIESMVRDDARRRLLHEFDLALTRLRSQHGDSADTTQLTGTYHNLLRMWAET